MNRVVVETCEWLRQAQHEVGLACIYPELAAVSCATFTLPLNDYLGALERCTAAFQPDIVQVHHVHQAEAMSFLSARFPTAVFLHDQTWFCCGGDRADRNYTPCHRPHGLACLFWNYAQGCGGLHPVGNWQRWRRTNALNVLRSLSRARVQVASRFMRRGLEENGYSTDRIDVVPLFAEPPPSDAAPEPGLILLPSRLVPAKGVQVALQAMARLSSQTWRLVIAGDGNQRRELEFLARHLGLSERVQFLGEISPEELGGWYARAQLVLFPVLRHEPFGLIGVESLAYGRPIVAFGGGAVEEWLWPGETGLRVEERTPEAFAEAIRELLLDPVRCQTMGRAARDHYEFFRPTIYVERLVKSFERTRQWFATSPAN